MSTPDKVKGPASYFPSIEKTYGKPIEHWMQVLGNAGPLRHMELVAHLESAHALGHGHANALVAAFLARKQGRMRSSSSPFEREGAASPIVAPDPSIGRARSTT